jgi:hypothetical protein
MVGEDSKQEKMCLELAGTHFTIGKKNLMKILEYKRSGIGLIAEFRGIPNRFPNQDASPIQKLNSKTSLRNMLFKNLTYLIVVL